jgi:hypothetical protein
MTALPNATTPFVNVDNTNTTTIVFSTLGDSVTPSRDIAVWNEIPFWQAFGGRTTTFQWIPKP